MSRSRRYQKPRVHGDGCFLCTGLRKGQRRVASCKPAPSVSEGLNAMCDCPPCRGGYENQCWASFHHLSELGVM